MQLLSVAEQGVSKTKMILRTFGCATTKGSGPFCTKFRLARGKKLWKDIESRTCWYKFELAHIELYFKQVQGHAEKICMELQHPTRPTFFSIVCRTKPKNIDCKMCVSLIIFCNPIEPLFITPESLHLKLFSLCTIIPFFVSKE